MLKTYLFVVSFTMQYCKETGVSDTSYNLTANFDTFLEKIVHLHKRILEQSNWLRVLVDITEESDKTWSVITIKNRWVTKKQFVSKLSLSDPKHPQLQRVQRVTFHSNDGDMEICIPLSGSPAFYIPKLGQICPE